MERNRAKQSEIQPDRVRKSETEKDKARQRTIERVRKRKSEIEQEKKEDILLIIDTSSAQSVQKCMSHSFDIVFLPRKYHVACRC